jgi:Cap4 SAVED domain
MVQFNDWCNSADTAIGNHRVRVMTGRPADATVGVQVTASAVPGHYAAEERIARALARLRKPEAAKVITDLLPQTPQIRSGDLGEIYATEWINAHSGYRAPIKRLRWKDHRDMAMRGDDVIGMIVDPGTQRLRFLKTEAKTGYLAEWNPRTGWKRLPGSEAALNNGIQLSADSRSLENIMFSRAIMTPLTSLNLGTEEAGRT